jgi:hypothetical protein
LLTFWTSRYRIYIGVVSVPRETQEGICLIGGGSRVYMVLRRRLRLRELRRVIRILIGG